MNTQQAPQKITLHKAEAVLELQFASQTYRLPAEYLRVHSPSAEVQGHGPDQAILQYGKRQVRIERLEATGHYGLRIFFDDGHNTGLYSWRYLHDLGSRQDSLWQNYLDQLNAAGKSRDPHEAIVKLITPD